ncbi:MAG: FtsX-like permease family protein [Candidatus Heimdallarchaeota archaeon]
MGTELNDDSLDISIKRIFRVFLKTGKKRVILSISAGMIIFLAITTLTMVLYRYHYLDFATKEQDVNWYADTHISAKSNHRRSGYVNLTTEFFNNFTSEFVSQLEGLFPGVRVENFTAATSMQMFYPTGNWIDPVWFYEIMAVDDTLYQALNCCLSEGRLPQNESELLVYPNDLFTYDINETMELHPYEGDFAPYDEYTICGIIDENVTAVLLSKGVSPSLFEWLFSTQNFHNFWERGLFITNVTNYQKIVTGIDYYTGIMTYLVDADYDLSQVDPNRVRDYARAFPGSEYMDLAYSIPAYVILAPDLKIFLTQYSNEWNDKFTNIVGLNPPLIFIMGLFCAVTITIGSKDLASTFRRMKLYGLSYNNMRLLIFLENLIFSFVSFIGGTGIGFFINYLMTKDISFKPPEFYLYFIQDPLFLISLSVFFVAFFVLSFGIQNSIARATTRDAHEEYKMKRKKIRALFSSNEFKLLVIALVFALITLVLYIVFNSYGSRVPQLNTFAYNTLFMFLFNCSIALVAAFLFLLFARFWTFLWSMLSKWLWNDKLNIITLSIKHIADSKNIYQITILASLVFGVVIIPGFAMETSIPAHLTNDAKLAMGGADLLIDYWLDPNDEMDYIFDEIDEIRNTSEIRAYRMINANYNNHFPKPYEISALAIQNLETFIEVVDLGIFDTPVESILALETDYTVLVDRTFAKDNNLASVVNFTTAKFSYYRNIDLSYVNSFDYFPATKLVKKNIFQNKELVAMVANQQTIKELVRTFDFSTDIYFKTQVMVKAVNESVIPIIKEKLATDYGVNAKTFEDVYNDFYFEIDSFLKSNLYFFAFLGMFTLVFIGYFSGNRIFNDRMRTIESLYRVGAVRRQILTMFTFELILVNLIPLIGMIFAAFPLSKFLSVYYLGVSEIYIPFKSYYSGWLITLIILGGIMLSIIGWWIALIPQIYRYRPVKQE